MNTSQSKFLVIVPPGVTLAIIQCMIFFRKRMEFYELISRKEFLHVGNKRHIIMLYSLVYIKVKKSHPFLFGKLNGFWMVVVLQHIRNFSQKSASAIFCHIREDRPTESSALQHLQPCYNSAGYVSKKRSRRKSLV